MLLVEDELPEQVSRARGRRGDLVLGEERLVTTVGHERLAPARAERLEARRERRRPWTSEALEAPVQRRQQAPRGAPGVFVLHARPRSVGTPRDERRQDALAQRRPERILRERLGRDGQRALREERAVVR